MEEVDKTILLILHSVGCRFPAGVESIDEFTTDHLVLACSHALHAVSADNAFPTKLPKGNAARFRICTEMSKAIADLGYQGENGYQAFLYPVAKDMRRLLSWLVERLPKTDDDDGADDDVTGGTDADLNRSVKAALSAWAARAHCPFAVRGAAADDSSAAAAAAGARPLSTAHLALPLWDPSRGAEPAPETLDYLGRLQPLAPQQCHARRQWLPSLVERNAHEVALAAELDRDWEAGDAAELRERRRARAGKLVAEAFQAGRAALGAGGSAHDQVADMLAQYAAGAGGEDSTLFSRRTAFGQDGEDGGAADEEEDEDEETRRRKHDEELEALRARLQELAERGKALRRGAEEATSAARMLEGELASATQVTRELEGAYKVKKRTLDLLPEADSNMAKLREIGEASAQRLFALAEEWEGHRVPMLAKYRRQKQRLSDRKQAARTKLEQIKRMRAEMKELAQVLREKDDLHRRVLEELNKLPKSVHRGVYVRRIMDIVKNLDRQKDGIRKILGDVRTVQREINMATETNQRSFAVADELVFQGAQGGPRSKTAPETTKAYKCLVTMRKGFETLVQRVEEVGRVKNDARDLESRIEALESRNTAMNMERIKADLSAVKKENKQMAAKLSS